jgi:predicted transcriptional regulator
MRRQRLPAPTAAELEILRVLWEHGPSTVRDVHGRLDRATGYTTVLKLLQIMTEKGLVARDERERAHVYSAALDRNQVERRLVGDLVERAFGGSPARLVLQALSSQPTSAEELARIREFLDRMEGGHR